MHEHSYTFSDIYETVNACDRLELLLHSLRWQRVIAEEDWLDSRSHVAAIRSVLEAHLQKRS